MHSLDLRSYHEPELKHFVAIPAVVAEHIEAMCHVVVAIGVQQTVDLLAVVVVSLRMQE